MDKPHIVFILTDQHHNEMMGNANDKYIKTPNLDKLAKEGTRFKNAYTNCPVCAPARMSLLSGQLPLDHGCLTNFATLDSNIPTYAHSMNIGGYQTVLGGRMHIHGADQYRGNELRLTGDNTPIYAGYDNLTANMGDELKLTIRQNREGIDKSGGGYCIVQEYDNAVVSDAMEFLDKRDDDRPLMFTIGLFSPHPPFIADVEKYKYYYNIIEDAPVHPNFEKNMHKAIVDWKKIRDVEDVTKEEWRRIRAAYYANVEFLDENIGKIIKKAKEKLGENIVFIYSSDHGESMGINNIVWKTTYFESSVKIPLIFSGPGIEKDRIVEGLVCLNDVTRTLIDYSKGPELPKAYGISLKNVLENGEEIAGDRSIISQIGGAMGDVPAAMIRKGDYKLISYYGYDRVSLYNMKVDSLCGNDLGENYEFDGIKEKLLLELSYYWNEEKAQELSVENFENFKIMSEWANITKFPLMEKFYNGLENDITANWSMDSEDNYIEAQ